VISRWPVKADGWFVDGDDLQVLQLQLSPPNLEWRNSAMDYFGNRPQKLTVPATSGSCGITHRLDPT